MALIEWMDMFSVGDPAMDNDHKALIALLNRLYEVWANGEALADIEAVFDELTEYTISHFTREEVVLGSLHYERLSIQAAEHARLLGQLDTFKDKYLSGEAPSDLSQNIVDFLRSWVINHILEEDMQYRETLSAHRQKMSA